jgi:hypothetical protein
LTRGHAAGSALRSSQLHVTGPVWRGRNAFVYKVESPWLPGTAALKACRNWTTGEPDASVARRQFSALVDVNRKLGSDGRYRVPAPYAMFEDYACYLAAWIDGISMSAALVSRRSEVSLRARIVTLAGEWLRHFHTSKDAGAGYLDVGAQLPAFASLPRSPRVRQRRSSFNTAVTALRSAAPEIASIELSRSWAHGDYKPGNILLANNYVYAIDVAASEVNIVAFDIAQFLNDLSAIANDSRDAQLVRCLPVLESAFWNGYGEADPGLRRVVTWLRIALLMESHEGTRQGLYDLLRRLWRGTSRHRMIDRLTEQLTRGGL